MFSISFIASGDGTIRGLWRGRSGGIGGAASPWLPPERSSPTRQLETVPHAAAHLDRIRTVVDHPNGSRDHGQRAGGDDDMRRTENFILLARP
jgi:hypothetical protein